MRIPGMLAWGVTLACVAARAGRARHRQRQLSLPLHIAVLHNAGAALLLFVLVSLIARVRPPEA
jgi:cytochrome c oxidase assembly protein subunit 15